MADIVFFPTGEGAEPEDPTASHDTFLLTEGLELLADFRAIEDRTVRDSVRQLVRSMAVSARRCTGTKS